MGDIANMIMQMSEMQAEIDRLRGLLREVGSNRPGFDDVRLSYVTVQIDRDTWDAIVALSPAPVEVGGASVDRDTGQEHRSPVTPNQREQAPSGDTTSTSQAVCPECKGDGLVIVGEAPSSLLHAECKTCHGTGRSGGKR